MRINSAARSALKASLTIECALSLPLFFFCMTSMISMMDLYRKETIQLSSLCEKAKMAATYTYNPIGDGLTDITLPDYYTFTPVSGLLPLPPVRRINMVTVRSWNGKEHQTFHDSLVYEKMVYVTDSGTVYHRKVDCRYLSVKVTAISSTQLKTKKNSYGQKYSPCERCVGNSLPYGLVYVTAKGTHYHNSEACSALKRSIRLVRESEAGLPPCSACAR